MGMIVGAVFFLTIVVGVVLMFTSPVTGINPVSIVIGTLAIVVIEIIITIVIARIVDDNDHESECSDEEYAKIVKKDFENDNLIKFHNQSSNN